MAENGNGEAVRRAVDVLGRTLALGLVEAMHWPVETSPLSVEIEFAALEVTGITIRARKGVPPSKT